MVKRVQHNRAQAGMTLIELLAALAILAILGTMVTMAMATGSRVMAETTAASNASVLEQSIDTALFDVLRYANVQAPAGNSVITDPVFDSDSYTDQAGYPVRNGQIIVSDGMLALLANGATQSIPKASGIYTDFAISSFSLQYDGSTNLFTGSYTIILPGGTFTRTCDFACRSLVEETNL